LKVISESQKITKTTIESAWKRRAKDQRLIVRDKECKGLALIVNATSMVWSYAYRPRGTDPATSKRWPNRTLTLGNPATLSPDDARNEAQKARGQAAAGTDPLREKKAKLEADQKNRSTTFDRLLPDYEKAFPRRRKMRGSGSPSKTYVANEVAQVRLALEELHAPKGAAGDLTPATIRKWLDNSGESGSMRARFGALSRFLDWCQDAGHIALNPCGLIARSRRPKGHQARAHFLQPVDLARLWKAAEDLPEPVWRDIARFMIALPCRRGEAASLDWAHLDLSAAEWRQPGKLTKNGEPHRLHLHALALNILELRRRAAAATEAGGDDVKIKAILAKGAPRGGLVFPGPKAGKKIDTFTSIKTTLTEKTKPVEGSGEPLTGWTWHDFRRSFASALGEAGIPEAVADAVLNHRQAATRGGVLGVYQRSSRWPEQVKAMELWGRLLADALAGKKAEGT
jgi:integrase